MSNLSAPALLALILVCTVTSLTAAGPAIGSATANGSFRVDSSTIRHNTTLFDGSTVETNAALSEVRLNDGARFRLAADSRMRVYRKRIVLERGASQLQATVDTPLEARTLKIYSASADSVAQVHLNESKVLVAAVKGSIRVTNASGVLVANLAAPGALTFDPQAGTAAATQVSGCLLSKSGKFIIVDQTTNVTMEVYGAGLVKEAGNKVEITGTADAATPSVAGTSQRISVTDVKLISKGGCASIAKKIGATAGVGAAAGAGGVAAAGGAAAAGIGTAATVAIVGGVAAAATTASLAAVGSFSGGEEQPATSR